MKDELDLGHAAIEPSGDVVAGSRGTWKITYTVGKAGIAVGGAVKLLFPSCQFLWEPGKVIAYTDSPDTALELDTSGIYPLSFHLCRRPVVTATIQGAPLLEGQTVTFVIGFPGDYASGFNVLSKAPELAAKGAEFQVLVDPVGNASYLGVTNPRYLGEFKKLTRCPRLDIVPAPPVGFLVTARATPAKGEKIRVVVAPQDQHGNHCESYTGTVRLFVAGKSEAAPVTCEFKRQDRGSKIVVLQPPDGEPPLYCVASDWRHSLIGKSNPVSPDFCEDGYRIFFGEIHNKTALSDGLGSPDDAYRYARDFMGLDFAAVSDHEGGREFGANRAAVKRFYKPGEFVTLLGFEHSSSSAFGHRNVYYPTDEGEALRPDHPDELWRQLEGKQALVIPHHTNIYNELQLPNVWQPFDWSSHNPRYEHLVEICQNRGSFETNQPKHAGSFGGCDASVQDALAMGCRLGFIGGTDNHAGQPGSFRCSMGGLDYREKQWGGLACVFAKELTREAVWDALWTRHTYATNGARILLDVTINGHRMGEEVRMEDPDWPDRVIRIKVLGTARISFIDIVRNNDDIYTFQGRDVKEEFEYVDRDPFGDLAFTGRFCSDPTVFYYVRVLQEDEKMAWSSPIWFSVGRRF